MPNKTIAVQLSSFSGDTELSIRIKKNNIIVNTPVDSLIESEATGYFTSTLTEVTTEGWYSVDILKDNTIILSGGNLYLPGDIEGTYLVDDPAVGSSSLTEESIWGYSTRTLTADVSIPDGYRFVNLIVDSNLDNIVVLVTRNEDGTEAVFSGLSINGQVSGPLPIGTLYVFRSHPDYQFENPYEIEVTEETP